MPHLSPPTLTESETRAILAATAGHPRDHLVYSLALGTGLRLAEIVGLTVGCGRFAFWDPALAALLLADPFTTFVKVEGPQ